MNTKRITVGILAHVDAGKTTLAEGILYLSGSIRKLGRVDHQDAFLDNFALERSRGITIFSKQAELTLQDTPVTLLDTPGHVDFSAEMERTLQVLDYAVLVISGADGVQGHVETLWRLLTRYQIPTFLFVNKMDQPGTDRDVLMAELTKRLDSRCIDFTGTNSFLMKESVVFSEKMNSGKNSGSAKNEIDLESHMTQEDFFENLAMCDETLLEQYLETEEMTIADVRSLVAQRKVFPCYFGSALKMQGVEELLEGIRIYSHTMQYPDVFGARVYKITRDLQGNRLTHMKITGGSLKVKELLSNNSAREEERWEAKADQIRIYSGSGYQMVQEAQAGMICAVTGLEKTYAGEGLGAEREAELPVLEPVLSYRIGLDADVDVHQAFLKLRQLEEEEPQLHIVWDEQLGEIHAQLMGEVQIEVLKNIIRERFGMYVEFGTGNILYKETIRSAVVGMGHFEPLRHYAEAHLLLEPGERGSGLQFFTVCSEDVLDRNWQRLILTHLEEKQHRGVLTGAEITDMRITLLTGRAHLKHTEGGDFRQATYRAVRHGLRCAESVLLEPVYEFRLEVPAESVGRAMADIQKMCGNFEPPQMDGEYAVLSGTAPVVTMRGYQTEVLTYTKGRGRMFCTLKGYEECHNAEEVIAAKNYDPEADLENPTGSVFCAHGAGFVVNWDEVKDYVHLESGWDPESWEQRLEEEAVVVGTGQGIHEVDRNTESQSTGRNSIKGVSQSIDSATSAHGIGNNSAGGSGVNGASGPRKVNVPSYTTRKRSNDSPYADEKELEEIFARTYGTGGQERKRFLRSHKEEFGSGSYRPKKQERMDEVLLVDGYNIIFAWDELKELAKISIDGARGKLLDILSNYQGYKKNHLIVVFDAYKVEGGVGSVQKYHNIYAVYTKEAETADQYIEKTVREIDRKYHVTVATSDALEQMIILGAGATRMSASDLWEDVQIVTREIRENYIGQVKGGKNYLFDHLTEEMTGFMEDVRLGKKKLNE